MGASFNRAAALLLSGLMSLLLFCAAITAASAQSAPAGMADREWVIGVKDAPPFAIKVRDGEWQGISVELWRKIAADLNVRYRFAEVADVPELLAKAGAGTVDLAVSALTVTAARQKAVDFTPSFYSTGFGIAVPAGGEASWRPVVRAITSFGFLQSIVVLIGLALLVGIVVWLIERRHNEEFGGGIARGLSSSVWWTTVAMTQRGIGHRGPRTMPGRAVAMFWMVGSIIATAIFTASITSVLTVKQLRGVVHDVGDLTQVRVGVVLNTSTEDVMAHMRLSPERFPTLRDALLALRAGKVDAVVHDRPLLGWKINQEFRSSVELLEVTFRPQQYAFAMAHDGPLRKEIAVSLLSAVHTDWWDQLLLRYVGMH